MVNVLLKNLRTFGRERAAIVSMTILQDHSSKGVPILISLSFKQNPHSFLLFYTNIAHFQYFLHAISTIEM